MVAKGGSKMSPVCPDCESRGLRYRVRRKSYVCERCGWSGKQPDWVSKEKGNGKVKL